MTKTRKEGPRVNKEKNYGIKTLHEKKHPLSMAYAEINSYYACEKSKFQNFLTFFYFLHI